MSNSAAQRDTLFMGPGAIRARCREIDWAATSLGPSEGWPQGLRLAVRMCLDARFPMCIWAGPELVLVYNDGYPPVVGPARHPWALGRPAREVWAELWDRLGPELDRVVSGGESTVHTDERFVLRRGAGPEECFFTYSFTPIQDTDGRIVGALNVFVETTDRVRSLGEHQARYRAVFESASDAILVTDLERGRVLSANPAACRLFGYGEDELHQLGGQTLVEDAAAAGRLGRALVEAGRAVGILGFRRKDGSAFDGELHATSFTDARGRRAAVSIVRDVTERQRAERALVAALAEAEEGRQTLRALMESVPEGITIADEDGVTIRMVSRFGQELLGGAHELPAEEVARRWRAYRPDGYTPMPTEELPLVRAVRRGETVHGAEVVQLSVEGRRLSLVCDAAPIRGDGGRILGGIVAWRDVTEQKRAEAALRASEERYRTLFQLMDEGFCIVELLADAGGRPVDYRFVEANPAFERHTGLRDPVGRTGRELVPGLEPGWIEAYARVASTGRPERFTERSEALGRWFEVHAFPVGPPEQRRVAVLFGDVTERQEAADALRAADRRKNEFLGVLSHELRNPLAPIKNSLFVLQHAPPGGEQALRAREVVGRQVDQLARLVDDLLEVTRISRGKVHLQRRRIGLAEAVHHTVDDHRSLFEHAGLRLEVDLPAEPVTVDADPSRLAQVVGNLLQNAAKFTPAGGRVRVSVSVGVGGAGPAGAPGARIEVADTGVGLAPELTGHLFEPFMQADSSLHRARGGLGLGLALVRGLVELHGGAVSATSGGPGRGSTFTVWLPLAAAAGAAREARHREPAGAARRRVLVIEDNVDAANSLRDLLRLQGHEVAVAYDGDAGIALARQFRPDAVLCDLGLPGLDGYAVARSLRADADLRGVRLLAVSGYARPEDVERAGQAGFQAHLAKPPDLRRLAELLAEGAGAAP